MLPIAVVLEHIMKNHEPLVKVNRDLSFTKEASLVYPYINYEISLIRNSQITAKNAMLI